MAAATKIAAMFLPVAMMVKESVNRAYETSLAEGLLFEGRTFHATFGMEDQKEGMNAFIEKRKLGLQGPADPARTADQEPLTLAASDQAFSTRTG